MSETAYLLREEVERLRAINAELLKALENILMFEDVKWEVSAWAYEGALEAIKKAKP